MERRWWLLLILAVLTLTMFSSSLADPPPFQTSSSLDNSLSVVFPSVESYSVGEQMKFYVHVFNSSGSPVDNESTNCSLYLYGLNGSHELEGLMLFDVDEGEWFLNVSSAVMSRLGVHPFLISCVSSAGVGGFVSGRFEVTTDGSSGEESGFAFLVMFLPFLFSFLLVFGARLFNEVEHWVLHVAAYLLALVSGLAGLWWAGLLVVRFGDWLVMGDALGWWSWASGLMVVVLAVYWMIYIFQRVVHVAAQRKERRLLE